MFLAYCLFTLPVFLRHAADSSRDLFSLLYHRYQGLMKNYKQTHNDEDRPKSVESNVNVSIIEIGESSQSQLLLGSLGLKSTKIRILVILNNTSFHPLFGLYI